MPGFASRLALGVAFAASVAAAGMAQGPSSPTDWPSTNYSETANRYSPLDQITAANVTTLQQAWSVHLKPAAYTGRMREDEAIPLVIGNTMYLASPYSAIIALDATTGAEKWRFQLPNNDQPAKRGLAYWPGDASAPPSLIFGVLSGSMYSLKASDGTPNAGFGENGVDYAQDTRSHADRHGRELLAPVVAEHLQEPRHHRCRRG